ncbi:GAF domain-containing protein [Nocardia arthritidis]|uniref:Rv3651-like N-terminal domain-containing protein n=1 Tax=Nocardia arthritidis TaxID=228602 RepID=A0A6G9YSA1_9NOCA|nr:GAF domain-containing protein [Nocardia arthritidis]QIS15763.1 hypothetical protein F5544_39725 [Nocardia arthritidis]
MTQQDWLLIETLGHERQPTLVADGDRIKDWVSLVRVQREPSAAVYRIADVVRRCVESVMPATYSDDTLIVLGIPVPCAFGAAHAVQVWVGGPGDQPPPRRGVGAWDWDADSELAKHGPGLEELAWARAPEDVRVTRTPPEVFSTMVRFDGRLDYMAMVREMRVDGRWQGEVDMRGDDGRVRRFQMIARANPAMRRTQGLIHDVTDVRRPRPDADMSMMRAVSRRSSVGVGFVELGFGLIYEWPSPPPPPLDRWATERPEIHPDDAARYRRICDEMLKADPELAADDVHELVLRIRFADTGWLRAHAELRHTFAGQPGVPGHGLIRVRPAE